MVARLGGGVRNVCIPPTTPLSPPSLYLSRTRMGVWCSRGVASATSSNEAFHPFSAFFFHVFEVNRLTIYFFLTCTFRSLTKLFWTTPSSSPLVPLCRPLSKQKAMERE